MYVCDGENMREKIFEAKRLSDFRKTFKLNGSIRWVENYLEKLKHVSNLSQQNDWHLPKRKTINWRL